MKVFTPARPRSPAINLGLTALQTIVFWVVFLGFVPWSLERWAHDWPWQHLEMAGLELLGTLLGVGFAALNLWSGVALAIMGRGTPLPTQTARELVVRGPYRWVRNPMALGGLGVGFALGLARGSWLIMGYALAGGLVWHLVARPIEERDLEERFGDAYRAYKARVKVWWPRAPR